MSRSSILCIAATLLLATGTAHATTRTWPGAAPCAGTLQACIDGAADGDRIEIATNTPITDSIAMHARNLTLTAANGFRPEFLGVGIIVNDSGGSGSGDMTVSLSRLRFTNGYVTATYASTGTASFDFRELVLTRAPGATGNGITVIAYAGTVEAMLHDNRVSGEPLSLNGGLISLNARGGTLNARAYYNHVRSTAAAGVSGAGILVDVSGSGSAGTVKLHANDVFGSFFRGGICVSEGLLSSTPVNYSARLYNNVVVGSGDGSGIDLVPNFGNIDTQLINNTVTRTNYGVIYSHWNNGAGTGTGTVTGLLKNNLVRASTAVFIAAGNTIDNDYNLLNGMTPGFVPGPHTITADAALVSDAMPRLRTGSPAIDSADTSTLGLGLIVNGLPVTDADGLRRIKNPGDAGTSKADIGAYEFGDAHFVHTTTGANTSTHISMIDHAAGNDRPGANLFLTPNFDGGDNPPVAFNRPFGVWYASPQWTVFDEGAAAMPASVDFDVFAPARGSGVFRHVADAENTADWFSQIDDGSLNGLPDRIVLVTQNFSAGPAYNAHPVGVFYFSLGGPGAWMVANLDLADLPAGAGFNVYAQEPSPNAFRVAATAANIFGSALTLDHPLLDDTPCARPMATRLSDASAVSGHFDLDYYDGRWRIFSYSGMPIGTQFHVLVDPAQVFECRDLIFADGFD